MGSDVLDVHRHQVGYRGLIDLYAEKRRGSTSIESVFAITRNGCWLGASQGKGQGREKCGWHYRAWWSALSRYRFHTKLVGTETLAGSRPRNRNAQLGRPSGSCKRGSYFDENCCLVHPREASCHQNSTEKDHWDSSFQLVTFVVIACLIDLLRYPVGPLAARCSELC